MRFVVLVRFTASRYVPPITPHVYRAGKPATG